MRQDHFGSFSDLIFKLFFIIIVLLFFLLFELFYYISLVSLHTFFWCVLVIHSHILLLAKSCCVEVTSQFPQVNPVFVGMKYTPQPYLVQSYSHSFLKSVINWQPFVQQIQLIQLVYSELYSSSQALVQFKCYILNNPWQVMHYFVLFVLFFKALGLIHFFYFISFNQQSLLVALTSFVFLLVLFFQLS